MSAGSRSRRENPGPASKKAGAYEKLVSILPHYHSVRWIHQYFDLLKKILTELEIEDRDPRLAMTITNRKLPVNLGQRYILRPLPNEGLGILVPADFEEAAVNGSINFLCRKNGVVDAKWLFVPFREGDQLPEILYNACLEAADDILRSCKRSGYRRYHVSLLYHFTMETAVRQEIMSADLPFFS